MKTLHVVADSISLGYGPYLAQYVRPWFEYSRKTTRLGALDNPEGENGGDSTLILTYLDRARQQGIRWDLLLVNCGLHDIRRVDGKPQVALADYEQNLIRLFSTYGAVAETLVWVRTTPVIDDLHNGIATEFQRYDADVQAYNAVADRLALTFRVPVLDLNPFCLALGGREIYRDHVHFTDAVQARQAAFIAGWLVGRT